MDQPKSEPGFIERETLSALKNIRDVLSVEGTFNGLGICHSLTKILPLELHIYSTRLVLHVAKFWTKHSGNFDYPVPSPIVTLNAVEAFESLDSWTGKYGQLRRELLDFLIETLEKEIHDLTTHR
jgi:hypothetical protein